MNGYELLPSRLPGSLVYCKLVCAAGDEKRAPVVGELRAGLFLRAQFRCIWQWECFSKYWICGMRQAPVPPVRLGGFP